MQSDFLSQFAARTIVRAKLHGPIVALVSPTTLAPALMVKPEWI
jgi:hypothetical protein